MAHLVLHAFAQHWPKQMGDLVDAALDSGELDGSELRTIVLSPTQDRQRAGVWLGVEWENYPYAENVERAAGFVSLAEWLDEVDEAARGERTFELPAFVPRAPLRFDDPAKDASWRACWARLRQALVATAASIATERFASRFKQPVGVFITMDGAEARLTAICHPAGAPLLPLRERRKEHGFGSAYPQGALIEDGLVVFYPEGEAASLGAKGAAAIRTYRFRDMVRIERDEEDSLQLRFKGEVFDVELEAGHTHEEHGGMDRAQIQAALAAHFETSGLVVKPNAAVEALPADATALAALLDGIAEEHRKGALIEGLAERHGIAKVLPLAASCALGPKVENRYLRNLAREALREGRPAEALELLSKRSDGDRERELEARALIALGRLAEGLAAAGDDDGALPYRAIALARTGKIEEALKLLAGDTHDVDRLAARAVVLARAKDPAAAATLRDAFTAGTIEPDLLERVAAEPALAETLAARDAAESARAASRVEIELLSVKALALGAKVELAATASRGWAAQAVDSSDEELKLEVGLDREESIWVGNREGAVAAVARDGTVRPIARPFEERIEAMVAVPGGVVVSDGARLALLDEKGAIVARAQPWFRGDGPTAAKGALLAHGNDQAVDLYWAEGGLRPIATVGFPGDRRATAIAMFGARMVVVANQSVWVVDVTDPLRPRGLSSASLPDSVSVVGSHDDLIAFKVGGALSVMKVGDELTPIFSAAIDGEAKLIPIPISIGDTKRFGVLARGKLWIIDPARPDESELHALWGPDGYPLEARHLRFDAAGPTAVLEAGVFALSEQDLQLEVLAARLEREGAQLATWVSQQVATHLAEGQPPFGSLQLLWFDHAARLAAHGPISAPSLDAEWLWQDELPFANADSEGRAEGQLQRAVEQVRHENAAALRALAEAKLLSTVGREIAPRVEARDLLLLRYDQRTGQQRIVDVLAGRGSLSPQRATIEARAPKSTRERLTAPDWYRDREAMVLRARRDEQFRTEVLQLVAEEQLLAAGRIAEDLVDDAPVATAAAFLAAAERDPVYAIGALIHHADRPEVRIKLGELADGDDPEVALPARRALGRLDEERTVQLLADELARAGTDDEHELPELTLAAIPDARLVQLAEALRDAYARMRERHDRAEALLVPLARAGVWLEETMDAALEERREEELGEDWLPEALLDDQPALTALRHHVVGGITQRLAAQDDGGPLWPSEIPPESNRTGWQRFFDVAWPRWESAGLLDTFHQRLPARAMISGSPDAELALQTLLQDLLRGDLRAEPLGRALEAAPYEGGALKDVIKLARLSRVQYGWSLTKAKRYLEARRVADAALKDAPHDGQVLFFEARVAWLEKNDPEEALRRIPAALDKASDSEGRGRLFNLYGAALDAKGRYAESISWFEKGMAADPTQAAMFLSNIAEAHWKLGAEAEARKFADQAARRGSTTEIVKTILASARET